eukprot:12911394-Prorocentrum_lima.AAC.1
MEVDPIAQSSSATAALPMDEDIPKQSASAAASAADIPRQSTSAAEVPAPAKGPVGFNFKNAAGPPPKRAKSEG